MWNCHFHLKYVATETQQKMWLNVSPVFLSILQVVQSVFHSLVCIWPPHVLSFEFGLPQRYGEVCCSMKWPAKYLLRFHIYFSYFSFLFALFTFISSLGNIILMCVCLLSKLKLLITVFSSQIPTLVWKSGKFPPTLRFPWWSEALIHHWWFKWFQT